MTFQGPETCLEWQGVLKNVVLGTKNIKIGFRVLEGHLVVKNEAGKFSTQGPVITP